MPEKMMSIDFGDRKFKTASEFFIAAMKATEDQKTEAFFYTTISRLKYVCRLNGLTKKQSGRIIKKVANGRMSANDVINHLERVRKGEQ